MAGQRHEKVEDGPLDLLELEALAHSNDLASLKEVHIASHDAPRLCWLHAHIAPVVLLR